MKALKIFEYLNEIAPLKTAAPYDNSGFLLGDKNSEIKKAVVCLDCTKNVIKYAIKENAELIITHHPIIFDSVKSITAENNIRVLECLKAGISVISMHTNLDAADGGVNDCLAEALKLKFITKVQDDEGFCFRKGMLENPMTAGGLAKFIKSCLGGSVRYVDGGKNIKSVTVCGGSGGAYLDLAMQSTDALITADVKHSVLIDAVEKGFSVFDAGHFNTENVVVAPLCARLNKKFDAMEFLAYNSKEIKTI